MTTPYAKLLVSVNGAAATSGGVTVPAVASIQFQFENTTGWEKYRLEMIAYTDFALPAGWTNENGVYVFTGVDAPPPAFTLPSVANWGKWMLTLTVNDGRREGAVNAEMVDKSTALSMLSTGGVEDIGLYETTQFHALRGWLEPVQKALRTIGSGSIGPAGPAGPAGTSEVTPSAGITCTGATSGNVDTLIYTVPASPTGPGRFLHIGLTFRVATALVGAGSVTLTAGTSAGATDLIAATTITSATAVGEILGNELAKLGSLCIQANGYNAALAAGTMIYARLAATGTITTAPVLVAHEYGLPQ